MRLLPTAGLTYQLPLLSSIILMTKDKQYKETNQVQTPRTI